MEPLQIISRRIVIIEDKNTQDEFELNHQSTVISKEIEKKLNQNELLLWTALFFCWHGTQQMRRKIEERINKNSLGVKLDEWDVNAMVGIFKRLIENLDKKYLVQSHFNLSSKIVTKKKLSSKVRHHFPKKQILPWKTDSPWQFFNDLAKSNEETDAKRKDRQVQEISYSEQKEEHKMNQRALEEAMETTFVKPRKEVEDKIYFESIVAFALKTKVKTAKPLQNINTNTNANTNIKKCCYAGSNG
ncbi:zinc binding protein [Reticulomyxa filosa]|uniref:Zinc binding protein n=1 Tax=Reticulomyxa filosa TaxID=46433 RepID=X6LGE7_RETFI|nr:zinc binding protein [Reticulomyxa filosa]|eukprot:ETO00411.1 zinc binding protein [Reticulomyxa filosa]